VPINIDQASKEARKAHWIWKNKGNSNGSTESEKKGYDKEKTNIASSTATSIRLKER
jgi:hypothetical protein